MPTKDPEVRKQIMKRYRANHSEKLKTKLNEWRKNNPDKRAIQQFKYRETCRTLLNDGTAIRKMSRALGVSVEEIPNELIEVKLAILSVKRKVKELMK